MGKLDFSDEQLAKLFLLGLEPRKILITNEARFFNKLYTYDTSEKWGGIHLYVGPSNDINSFYFNDVDDLIKAFTTGKWGNYDGPTKEEETPQN